MTRPKKTLQQLADEHWNFLEGIFLEEMRMKMRLFKEAFMHGYGHGERRKHEVCTKTTKKRKRVDSTPR